MFDLDYLERMKFLYELTLKSPSKPMRKLQRTALKHYPLYFKENQRSWLSTKTAFKCFQMHCPLHKKQAAE